MTSETYNTADELRRIIAEGRISEEALQSITGIEPEKLRSLFDEAEPGTTGLTREPQALSNDESARLSALAAQLTEWLRIGDDERLKAIFESLTIECRLTLQSIAQLTGLDVDDLESALRDRTSSTLSIKPAVGEHRRGDTKEATPRFAGWPLTLETVASGLYRLRDHRRIRSQPLRGRHRVPAPARYW
jgi:hypothetical protein